MYFHYSERLASDVYPFPMLRPCSEWKLVSVILVFTFGDGITYSSKFTELGFVFFVGFYLYFHITYSSKFNELGFVFFVGFYLYFQSYANF